MLPESRLRKLRRGIFITFEGPEGCGKSTQSKLLFDHLKGRYPCVHTREPGGTALGERVRSVLLHSGCVRICDMAELFLFEAARSQIVSEVITPALNRRSIVICDRFSDATFSYQGYAGGVDLKAIARLDGVATAGLRPDLTILLDIDTVAGLRRARSKGTDRMERKAVAYHRRVRRGYLRIAASEPRRVKVIKVTGSIEDTQALVRREAEDAIRRYNRAG
jgi:dTMP kinase